MAGDNTLNFTDTAFDQDVINSDVPVLVFDCLVIRFSIS